MDPVVNDERTTALRDQVAALARELDPALSIHDFRITASPMHTNLIFDVVVPLWLPPARRPGAPLPHRPHPGPVPQIFPRHPDRPLLRGAPGRGVTGP